MPGAVQQLVHDPKPLQKGGGHLQSNFGLLTASIKYNLQCIGARPCIRVKCVILCSTEVNARDIKHAAMSRRLVLQCLCDAHSMKNLNCYNAPARQNHPSLSARAKQGNNILSVEVWQSSALKQHEMTVIAPQTWHIIAQRTLTCKLLPIIVESASGHCIQMVMHKPNRIQSSHSRFP